MGKPEGGCGGKKYEICGHIGEFGSSEKNKCFAKIINTHKNILLWQLGEGVNNKFLKEGSKKETEKGERHTLLLGIL